MVIPCDAIRLNPRPPPPLRPPPPPPQSVFVGVAKDLWLVVYGIVSRPDAGCNFRRSCSRAVSMGIVALN